MKKIAIIGPWPPPYGGVEVFVKERSLNVKKCLVIGTSKNKKVEKNIILIRKGPYLFDLFRIFFILLKKRKEIKEIEAHYATTFGFVAFLSKKILSIDYVVFCHGSDILKNLKRMIFRDTTMLALKNAKKIYVVSDFLKKKLDKEKIKSEVFDERINKKIFRNLKKKRKKWIVFVGSLRKEKGIDILIDSFLLIHKKIPKYKILVVGKWKDKKLFREISKKIERNKINKKVMFVGEKKPLEVARILNTAKLFVFPTTYEGYGRALEEALACGVKSVATDLDSLREISKRYKVKCVFVKRNVKNFAKAILREL